MLTFPERVTPPSTGYSPLHMAVAKSQAMCVKILLKQRDLNVNDVNKNQETALQMLQHYPNEEIKLALTSDSRVKK